MRNKIKNIIIGIGILLVLNFAYFTYICYSYPINTHISNVIVVFLGASKRLEKGVVLLKSGYAHLLYITGVQTSDQLTNFFNEYKISKEQVIISYDRYNNLEEYVQKTANFVNNNHITSLRLITSRYEMPTAILELRKLIPYSIVIIPHPVKEVDNYLNLFQQFFHYIYIQILNFFR